MSACFSIQYRTFIFFLEYTGELCVSLILYIKHKEILVQHPKSAHEATTDYRRAKRSKAVSKVECVFFIQYLYLCWKLVCSIHGKRLFIQLDGSTHGISFNLSILFLLLLSHYICANTYSTCNPNNCWLQVEEGFTITAEEIVDRLNSALSHQHINCNGGTEETENWLAQCATVE